MKIKSCTICNELNGAESRLSSMLPNTGIKNAILYETDNLVVIPSIGPLCEGHCLIVTKIHSNNVLISARRGGYSSEVANCIKAINSKYGNGKIIVLGEHGSLSCKSNVNLCSTEHGHLHAMPVDRKYSNTVVDDFFGVKFQGTFQELSFQLSASDEYVTLFLAENNLNQIKARIVTGGIYSQMLRKHISSYLNSEKWNWKSDAENGMLIRMVSDGFEINKTMNTINRVKSVPQDLNA